MRLIRLTDYKAIGSKGERKMCGQYECPICGEFFECIVSNVNTGKTSKCRLCANKLTAKAKADKASTSFIEKASEVHGDTYDYSKVVYTNTHTKVLIICREHGVFEQTPHNHLNGHGCDACARENNSISKRQAINMGVPITLYYVYIKEHNLWKIGCTSKSINDRFILDEVCLDVLYTKEYSNSVEGYKVESFILSRTKEHKYTGAPILRGGNTELRIKPIADIEYLVLEAENSI